MTRLLQDYVTLHAETAPDKVALVMGDERVTYGELDESSNRLARFLKSEACSRGDRVLLLLSKTPRTIMSMIGVLKADCAYVPVDVDGPAPRLAHIVRAADPSLILVSSETAPLLDELHALGCIGSATRIGSLDGTIDRGNYGAAWARANWLNSSPEPLYCANSTEDARAHPLHVRIDRDPERRRHQALERDRLRGVGRSLFWYDLFRPDFRASAAAFRSLHVRHLRHVPSRGATARRAAGVESRSSRAR